VAVERAADTTVSDKTSVFSCFQLDESGQLYEKVLRTEILLRLFGGMAFFRAHRTHQKADQNNFSIRGRSSSSQTQARDAGEKF
jgi:hypothetical protein